MRRSSTRLTASPDPGVVKTEPSESSNKRPRRSSSRVATPTGAQAQASTPKPTSAGQIGQRNTDEPAEEEEDCKPNAAASPEAGDVEDERPATTSSGPSAYELARLEKIRRNAEVMAKLGLSPAGGEMRNAVNSDAAQRARARGLKGGPRKAAPKLERTRESSRLRGKKPDGTPMEDPEAAFLAHARKPYNGGYSIHTADKFSDPPSSSSCATSRRLPEDVSMDASNVSADGTLRFRQAFFSWGEGLAKSASQDKFDRSGFLSAERENLSGKSLFAKLSPREKNAFEGGLVGRYGMKDGDTGYELAKPDDALTRLRGLSVSETGVCKVVRDRAYSLAWHPSDTKLLLAVGDKIGNLGLWAVDGREADDEDSDGVYQFKPHLGSVSRIEFDPLGGNKLLSTSYDGTIRRMDVEKGAFEQIYANDESDNVFITYSHLLAEERLLLVSDSVGHVTALDLRTNQQVWKREAHATKANTVHAHPTSRHLFATASLDRCVRLWDSRSLGSGTVDTKPKGMKPLVEMPHFRSVNSAHFSPTGEWLCTVGQDDKVKLFKDLAQANGKQGALSAKHSLPHNNQTGRWLTKFQASWDPKSAGTFAIGSMQKNPHGVHLYSVPCGSSDAKPSLVALTGGDIMLSIQSLVVVHPKRNVVAGVNSSGRAHVFM